MSEEHQYEQPLTWWLVGWVIRTAFNGFILFALVVLIIGAWLSWKHDVPFEAIQIHWPMITIDHN